MSASTRTPKFVWVIEQGSYSDYRVVGVFSSEAHAQRVLKALPKDEGPSLTKWSLNPAVAELHKGLKMWTVRMKRDGSVEGVDADALSAYHITSPVLIYRNPKMGQMMVATVWAKTERHAIKITNEKRARAITSGEWP